MAGSLVHAFHMAEWFRLSAILGTSWLEIAQCAVFMVDGIPLYRYVKVGWAFTLTVALIYKALPLTFHDNILNMSFGFVKKHFLYCSSLLVCQILSLYRLFPLLFLLRPTLGP